MTNHLLANSELLAHLLGIVLASIGVLAIWNVVVKWRPRK